MLPLSKYYFEVSAADAAGAEDKFKVMELSGVEREVQAIEYRQGSDPDFYVTKIPGMEKYSNVTMKKAMFSQNNKLFDWINTYKLGHVDKKTLIVSLLNDGGDPVFTWTFYNAWPTKLKVSDLKSDASELAIEEVELAYDKFIQVSLP